MDRHGKSAASAEVVYQYIQHYLREQGCSPTLREIAAGSGLTLHRVRVSLSWLQQRGRIRRTAGTARSIVLLDKTDN